MTGGDRNFLWLTACGAAHIAAGHLGRGTFLMLAALAIWHLWERWSVDRTDVTR